jgi:hypothetical protein
MNVGRLLIEAVAEITDTTDGRLLIVGSAMPSEPYVAQPVHLWALTGSTWLQLDATTAGGWGARLRPVQSGRQRVTSG